MGLAALAVIALGIFVERDTVTVAGLGMLIFALSSLLSRSPAQPAATAAPMGANRSGCARNLTSP